MIWMNFSGISQRKSLQYCFLVLYSMRDEEWMKICYSKTARTHMFRICSIQRMKNRLIIHSINSKTISTNPLWKTPKMTKNSRQIGNKTKQFVRHTPFDFIEQQSEIKTFGYYELLLTELNFDLKMKKINYLFSCQMQRELLVIHSHVIRCFRFFFCLNFIIFDYCRQYFCVSYIWLQTTHNLGVFFYIWVRKRRQK